MRCCIVLQASMTQRQSLLRYTKSVHKLCMEQGKESDDSGDEGQGIQGIKVMYLFTENVHLMQTHLPPTRNMHAATHLTHATYYQYHTPSYHTILFSFYISYHCFPTAFTCFPSFPYFPYSAVCMFHRSSLMVWFPSITYVFDESKTFQCRTY